MPIPQRAPSVGEMTARANEAGRQPVIFVHGLWLRPGSWDRWARLFEEAGYIALEPAWPGEEGHLVGLETIGRVADHFGQIAQSLRHRPAIVGHSFGGLIAQILAARGFAAATVAIDPAPFRGVLPLPLSALRSAWPALRNPANLRRQVTLTSAEFRYAFANAVEPGESDALYQTYAEPAPGTPIFQAAAANLNPWTEARVDTRSARRGPLLIVSGERDHTVPPVIARAAFNRQRRNPSAVTEYVQMGRRGHSLTVDAGWREVAETALSFIKRFA